MKREAGFQRSSACLKTHTFRPRGWSIVTLPLGPASTVLPNFSLWGQLLRKTSSAPRTVHITVASRYIQRVSFLHSLV